MYSPVYLAGLFIATLLAGACLAAIVIYFEPMTASWLVFLLFYLSLLIGFTGFFSLIGLFIRRFSRKRMEVAFRQGFLLATILISALILQSQRILVWWHLVVLVALVGLAEWWLSKR